jgi:uncharacterized membrane protein (DUF485 family)
LRDCKELSGKHKVLLIEYKKNLKNKQAKKSKKEVICLKEKESQDSRLLELKIESLRIKREHTLTVFYQSLFIYSSFMFVAVIGFINRYLNSSALSILLLIAIFSLIIGIIPYTMMILKEEKELARLYNELEKKISK